MVKRAFTTVVALGITVGAVACERQPAGPDGPTGEPADAVQADLAAADRFIVVLESGVDAPAVAQDIARARDGEVLHVYTTALNGFALRIPAQAIQGLERDPRVDYVSADRVRRIVAQTTPTGVDRIEADRSPASNIDGTDDRVDVEVAIIDTGLDQDHPDLNILGGRNFANGRPDRWNDGNGHGTHVGGTVAALDNDSHVPGVAPGAGLWAVRVCGNSGFCFESDIIAGIDWVAERADRIAVANMSLGGSGSDDGNCGFTNDDPEHQAICAAVDAGVVFVVAAGNSGEDAANFSPANYDEVLTVSALADFDGVSGGLGSPTCRSDEDDTLANFSNFGADVDVAAPGVCILSTWNDGGTNVISGTSMASPHAAGIATLDVAVNGRDRNGDGVIDGADVDAVKASLIDNGIAQDDACGFTDESGDGFAEPLVFANSAALGGDGSCS